MRLTARIKKQVFRMHLTVDTYVLNNHVRLTTRVYGTCIMLLCSFVKQIMVQQRNHKHKVSTFCIG